MLALLLFGCGEPPYSSPIYEDPAHWLCLPGDEGDVCATDLDSTTVNADGSTAVVAHEAAEDPAFDCFYVYPTVSLDETNNADLQPGIEEPWVTQNQAARLNQVCRVFAPVYRQVTVKGLFTAAELADWELGFTDVADAWKHYLAQHNDDRGVLLIGHSQGSAMLERLLREVIEPDPEQADRIVAAYLIGGGVEVPSGGDRGGDLDSPLCASADAYGCVVSYLSYRHDEPPGDDAFFTPAGEGSELACVDPSDLVGGGALRGFFPTEVPDELSIFVGGEPPNPYADGGPAIDTPFFTVPGLIEGSCDKAGDIGFLSITVNADESDPRADDITGDFLPGWGLHLIDVHLAMGDLVELAERQHAAWASR